VRIINMLIFLVTVPGSLLIYLPAWLILTSSAPTRPKPWLRAVALIAWLIGSLTSLWCVADFLSVGRGTPAPTAPTRALVQRGLYRWVRNPMYVSVLILLVGHTLWFQRLRLLLYTAGVFALFHTVVVRVEEPGLRARFGDSYAAYCARIPRWLPRLPAARSGDRDPSA